MNRQFSHVGTPTKLSAQYATAFTSWIRGAGHVTAEMTAVLNEGTSTSGGFAVPVTVDGQIVRLAPIDAGVRTLATVQPTTSDLKIPFETAAATATAIPEDSAFTMSSPTLGGFTLSAFMAGGQNDLSIEIFQDVKMLPGFVIADSSGHNRTSKSRGSSVVRASVSRRVSSAMSARVLPKSRTARAISFLSAAPSISSAPSIARICRGRLGL